VGILAKDKFRGKFMTEWDEVYNPVKGSFEEIDVSPGITMGMSVKDDEEQVFHPMNYELNSEINSRC